MSRNTAIAAMTEQVARGRRATSPAPAELNTAATSLPPSSLSPRPSPTSDPGSAGSSTSPGSSASQHKPTNELGLPSHFLPPNAQATSAAHSVSISPAAAGAGLGLPGGVLLADPTGLGIGLGIPRGLFTTTAAVFQALPSGLKSGKASKKEGAGEGRALSGAKKVSDFSVAHAAASKEQADAALEAEKQKEAIRALIATQWREATLKAERANEIQRAAAEDKAEKTKIYAGITKKIAEEMALPHAPEPGIEEVRAALAQFQASQRIVVLEDPHRLGLSLDPSSLWRQERAADSELMDLAEKGVALRRCLSSIAAAKAASSSAERTAPPRTSPRM